MPHLTSLIGFALVSLGLVLTPGPNMIYLISRSITQGPAAGIVSLGGVALGFVFYMMCAAFGITALLFAVPYAYDALRLAGAAYLLWLAWQALRPNGRSPFQVKKLAVDGPRKLFAMGFVTNLLNPKIAMLYLALLPQFIEDWSLTNTQGGWLAGSLFAGYMLAVLPLVSLTDRQPARRIYLVSGALNALSCFLNRCCHFLNMGYYLPLQAFDGSYI